MNIVYIVPPVEIYFVISLHYKWENKINERMPASVMHKIIDMFCGRAISLGFKAYDIPMQGDIRIITNNPSDEPKLIKFRDEIVKPLMKRLQDAGFLYSEEELNKITADFQQLS